MHPTNILFWQHVDRDYRPYLERENLSILEVGSNSDIGSVRHLINLDRCKEYIGVDWREGTNVQHVCLAHEMDFGRKFDMVLSCSMLEHDPYWAKSLPKMVEHIADDGIFCLSWGAAKNAAHCFDMAVDGQFHALPAGRVLELLESLGVYVHEFMYEGKHFGPEVGYKEGEGLGEVCLVAFKDPKYATGPRKVDELIEEDR